jgi:hypothetical protein
LPYRALGAAQAADAEAIELDQFTGMIDLQVPLRRRLRPFRGRWRRVAGDQPVAFGPGREAVAAQHPPHPIGRQDDPTPLRPGQLSSDPGRPEPRVTERVGDHLLLHQRAGGIRHPRHPPLSGPQDLRAIAVQLALPAVVGRGMDPHGPTRRPDIAQFCGHGEEP